MTNLTEIVQYEPGIYQLETTDPVLGGPDGIDNLQAKQLANRTAFLKKKLDDILSGLTVPVGLATMNYIQAQLDKLDHKQSVRVASTANISLSGVQTIDGVAVNSGDRVLVKNQTDATTNGIYTANGSTWSRAGDANEPGEVTSGLVVYVEEGTLQGKSRWQLTTPLPITIGSSSLTFGDITAGMAPLASPSFTGSPSAPTLARFATGGGLMNADAVKAQGIQANALRSIALSITTVTLTAADAGSAIEITGSGGGTLNLPLANSVPVGATISIRSSSTGTSTNLVKPQGSDTVVAAYSTSNSPGLAFWQVRRNDNFTLTSDGVSRWVATDESTEALIANLFTRNQNNGQNGFVTLPSGIMIQWIRSTNLGSQGAPSVFPTAFPNACLAVLPACTNGSSPQTISVGGLTVSGFNAWGSSAPMGFGAIAIGY